VRARHVVAYLFDHLLGGGAAYIGLGTSTETSGCRHAHLDDAFGPRHAIAKVIETIRSPILCEPDHTWELKSHASSNGKSRASLKRPPLRRTVVEHSLKTLLIIIALGAAVASPAFARSKLNGHQQRFTRSELNIHQQWSPRDSNIFDTHDRNLEGYPRPTN
jgi:hypothetical protein